MEERVEEGREELRKSFLATKTKTDSEGEQMTLGQQGRWILEDSLRDPTIGVGERMWRSDNGRLMERELRYLRVIKKRWNCDDVQTNLNSFGIV